MRLPGAKLVVGGRELCFTEIGGTALLAFEVCPCRFEQLLFERDNGVVVNHVRREVRLSIARLQQSARDELFGTDQQRVTGKRRHWLIRRVSITSRAQGQCLPPPLAGIVETINPRERRRSQIADAIRRRQRGDMQQQAGCAIFGRKWRRNWCFKYERAIAAHVRPSCLGTVADEPSA